jgi:hypothetical protein
MKLASSQRRRATWNEARAGRSGGVALGALAVTVWLASISAVEGRTYFFVLDVPSTLGGTRFTANQIVRSDDGVYSLAASLPAGAEILSLHARGTGVWLFSPARPTSLGGTLYEPRDVISYDGTTFTSVLAGSAAGIPGNARIDALFLDSGSNPVVSFDVPVHLGGVWYSQSDLLVFNGGFSLYWDAEAAGIPSKANVVGAAKDSAGTLVLTFDIPTNLGGTWYLPGQLVGWDGTAFTSYAVDPAWPSSAHLRDFSFLACIDADGDGFGSPGDASCRNGSASDCDDHNPAVYPGAPQVCDGVNNNCSDPSWPAVPANEADADHDGFRICNGDCDDTRAAVYPGAPQICDGVNDNCLDPTWPAVPSNETDADGDGSPACADCDDTNPAIFPGAPQLCDRLNNDCNDPAWPTLPANESDADGDGLSTCEGDCNDGDPTVHTPGEVRSVTLSEDSSTLETTVTWAPPVDPGGPSQTLTYDVLRSTNPIDFLVSGTCFARGTPSTSVTDTDVPPLGTVLYYSVRATNVCYTGVGSLGTDSAGFERAGPENCLGYYGPMRNSLYINQGDSRILTARPGTGQLIEYYGRRGSTGFLSSLSAVHYRDAMGKLLVIYYDEQDRPVEYLTEEGLTFTLDWSTSGIVSLGVLSQDGQYETSVAISLGTTSSMAPRTASQVPLDLLPSQSTCGSTVTVTRCGSPVDNATVRLLVQPTNGSDYFPPASGHAPGTGDYSFSLPCAHTELSDTLRTFCENVAGDIDMACELADPIRAFGVLGCAQLATLVSEAGWPEAAVALVGPACIAALEGSEFPCELLGWSPVPGGPSLAETICDNLDQAIDYAIRSQSTDAAELTAIASIPGVGVFTGSAAWIGMLNGTNFPNIRVDAGNAPGVSPLQLYLPHDCLCVNGTSGESCTFGGDMGSSVLSADLTCWPPNSQWRVEEEAPWDSTYCGGASSCRLSIGYDGDFSGDYQLSATLPPWGDLPGVATYTLEVYVRDQATGALSLARRRQVSQSCP